ncbi:MAG: hypothetical protein OEN55_18585, partial [Alphaproteobacteria bacterium]|nr:hypothetical protein [Alphaproteobacteria bacterium]
GIKIRAVDEQRGPFIGIEIHSHGIKIPKKISKKAHRLLQPDLPITLTGTVKGRPATQGCTAVIRT